MPTKNFQYTSTWVTKNAHVVSKFLNILKGIELDHMDEDGYVCSIVPGYDSIWELMTELKPKGSQDFESTTRKRKLKSQKKMVPASSKKKVHRGRPWIEKQESTGRTLKRKMASSSSMQSSGQSAKVARTTSPHDNQAHEELASTTMKTQLLDNKSDKVITVTTPQPLSSTTSRQTRSMTHGQQIISKKTRTKKPTKLSRSKQDMNARVGFQEVIQTTLGTSKSSTTLETQLLDNPADHVLTFTTTESSSSMTSPQTIMKQAVEETNQEAALQIEIESALEASKSSVTLESQLPDNEDHQKVKSNFEQAFEDIKLETPLNEVSDLSGIDAIDPQDLLAETYQNCNQELGPEIFSLEETDWQWLDKV